MEQELLKPDDLVRLVEDPAFQSLSFAERKAAGEAALMEASQWVSQHGGWTPDSFRDFGAAAQGFREEIKSGETLWESTKGVAGVIGQTVADSAKVLGLTAFDAVTVTDPSSSLEDLRFKAPGGSVLPSLGRGIAKAADAMDVTLTAWGSQADNALDEELSKLRQEIDEGKMPLERDALESWLQTRSDDVAEMQGYWYHDRRAVPPPTAEEMREPNWSAKYQQRIDQEQVSEETARAAYAQSFMHDPVSARLLAGYMQTRNPELFDQLSSRLKMDPRSRAMRDENEKARDAAGLAKFLKTNFGEQAAQLLDEAGDPMEWAGTVFAPLKGAKAIQRGRKAMDRATDLAQGVGGEMLSEQGSLQVDDPFATLERRREVARDTFFGALGLMGAGAAVKKVFGPKDAAVADPADVSNASPAAPSIEGVMPGTPPAPPTTTAAQVEVDGAAWQYDPARITPDALRSAAPETLAALQQAGIIQPPPVAPPSAPAPSVPAVSPVPGQPAPPLANPASAPVAPPSAPAPSVPVVSPAPGQPATPPATPASAPVAPPSAPAPSVPAVSPVPGQPAPPLANPASAPVAPPSAPAPSVPAVSPAPGQPATPPATPATAPVNVTNARHESSGGFRNTDIVERRQDGSTIVFGELVDLAARAIQAGQSFATWAAQMLKQFGRAVKQYLQGAWQAARQTSQLGAVGDLSSQGTPTIAPRPIAEVVENIEGWHQNVQINEESIGYLPEDLQERIVNDERYIWLRDDQNPYNINPEWLDEDLRSGLQRYIDLTDLAESQTLTDEQTAWLEKADESLLNIIQEKLSQTYSEEIGRRMESAIEQIEATGRWTWDDDESIFVENMEDKTMIRYSMPDVDQRDGRPSGPDYLVAESTGKPIFNHHERGGRPLAQDQNRDPRNWAGYPQALDSGGYRSGNQRANDGASHPQSVLSGEIGEGGRRALPKIRAAELSAAFELLPERRSGQERDVYFDKANHVAIKLTKPGEFGVGNAGAEGYMRRLAEANDAFEAGVQVVGTVQFPGEPAPRVVTIEPLRVADMNRPEPKQREIDVYMRARNFLRTGLDGVYLHQSRDQSAHDALPKNFVRDRFGRIYAVDVILREPNSAQYERYTQMAYNQPQVPISALPQAETIRQGVPDDTARGALQMMESTAPGITDRARLLRSRADLNEADFTPAQWAALEHAEGFFNPTTNQATVLLDNLRPRENESPLRAVARVILHERLGHEGLTVLRQSNPAFAKRWNELVQAALADPAILAELRAIAADPAYAELGGDPSLLVEEWFARQAEQLTEAQLAALKPTSLLGKLWRALKDALAHITRRFHRSQWTVREVRRILALSRQALARGESAATRPGQPLRLSAPGSPSSPDLHPSQFGERVQVDPRLTPEMRAAPVTEFPIQRQQDIHNQARDVIRQQGLAAAQTAFEDTTLPIPLRIAGLMQVAQNYDALSVAARATGDPVRVAEADRLVEAAVKAKVELESIGNKAGRDLAMFNTWARLSPDGMLARLERKLAKANETNPQIPATIPAAMRPKLQQMATAAMALPEGVLRTAAMADLMAEFSMIEGIKTGDLWWSVWYGNVLSGLATQSVNMAGSVENVLLSVLELGTLNPNSLSAYLRGLVRGMRQGAVEAWSVLKGGPLIKPGKWTPPGLSGLELMMRQGGPQTNFSNVREGARSVNQWAAYIASLGGVSRFVGRLLGGMDAIFYYTAHEGAAAVAIQRALRKSGIKPGTPQFRQEVIRQMGGDPAQYQADLQQARAELQQAGKPITKRDVMRRAWELVRERREQGASIEAANWAARTVYQNELRGSGKLLSQAIDLAQKIPLAGRLFVPFNQILSALFSRGLDYTGLGLARGLLGYHLMDLANPPATGRVRMTPMERRQRALAGVLGPVVGVAVAVYASQFKEQDDEDIPFWIYDSGPKDKTRRRQMPKGWQPYSIKVGGRYIRYSETPLGPMLAAVAGWLNAERYTQPDTIARRTNEQKLGIALQAAVAQYSDLGVLSGIAELMDVVTGNERLDKALKDKGARSLSGLVPVSGLMREIETLFDPTKIHADTVLESLQRDIPIVSGWGTKPDLNAFGEPLTEPGLPVVKRFVTQQKDDPNWSWVRRNGIKIPAVDLNEQLEIGRYLLPNEAQGTKLKDIYAARGWALAAADNGLLTREQRYHFVKRTGEIMKERIEVVRKKMESGPTGGVLPADAKIQVGNRMVPARDRLQTQIQAIFEGSKKMAMKEVVDMMVK